MRRLVFCCLLVLLGCSKIRRMEIGDNFKSWLLGPDRGVRHYADTIDEYITAPESKEYYAFKGDPVEAIYRIQTSVRGLGGTKFKNIYQLPIAVDKILTIVENDPVPATRVIACEELGRIVLRMREPALDVPEGGAAAAGRINLIARDLILIKKRIEGGEKVKAVEIRERLLAASKESPTELRSARQLVRIIASPPVAGSSGSIEKEAQRVVPGMVRRAVLIALRDVACGDPLDPQSQPDPGDAVRIAASDVLARVGSRFALEAARARLTDRLDPKERNADVRRNLLRYLGMVGGPKDFDVCLHRLDDAISGVRYLAQKALTQMTEARVEPTVLAWEEWRKAHPAWQITAEQAPAGVEAK